MKNNIKLALLVTVCIITNNAMGYFGQAPAAPTNSTTVAAPAFITPPKLNLFSDQDLADASWDKVDFSTPDFGTAQPANSNDPFGFPDENLLAESSSGENYVAPSVQV